ncbi:MAG: helix-turn-helix transcriptional regulator [Pseudoxanthomonas sp.]
MPLSDGEIEMAGRLKYFRESLKIRQIIVAEGSETKQGQLSEMEQGKKQIQPRVIFFLAQRYYLNADWLYVGRGEMLVPNEPEGVIELPAKYPRTSTALLEKRIRDLEERLAKMEAASQETKK